MKPYSQDDYRHDAQVQELNQNLYHLSASIEGLMKRLQLAEQTIAVQNDSIDKLQNCIELIADELDLIVVKDGAQS